MLGQLGHIEFGVVSAAVAGGLESGGSRDEARTISFTQARCTARPISRLKHVREKYVRTILNVFDKVVFDDIHIICTVTYKNVKSSWIFSYSLSSIKFHASCDCKNRLV